MIPYPFGKALFVWGDPVWVAASSSREELQVKRLELERTLLKITSEADAEISEH